MKILQLVPYFYPAWSYGGPGKLVYDISCYLAAHGNEVTVYTSDAFDSQSRMSKKLHVHKNHLTVEYFKNVNNYLAYTYNVFVTPGLYLKAMFEIKNFDIIHIHDLYTLQNFFVGIVARILGVPYVLSVHGCLEDTRIKQRNSIKKIFLWLYGYQLVHHAAKVVASSESERNSYLALGIPVQRIVRLGHGVSPKEFSTTVSKSSAIKRLMLPTNKTIITFLGRIHKIKGLDQLAKAMKLLKTKQDIHFVIAGSDDGYLTTLGRLINRYKLTNISLRGTCFGEEKKLLFKASDVFIYPSYSEGFSLGILEAGAAGLPLIVSKGCYFDEVATYKAGLVTDNDPEQLKKAIITLTDNKVFRTEASKNIKKLIVSAYSMKAIGDRLLKVYSDVLK